MGTHIKAAALGSVLGGLVVAMMNDVNSTMGGGMPQGTDRENSGAMGI